MSSIDDPSRSDPDTEDTPAIEPGVFPPTLIQRDQWLTWKMTDDGRKIPRAPHANPDWLDKYVSAHEPENWTDFETAQEWADSLHGHRIAFDIRPRDEHPDEDLILIDYDHVRDSDTGEIHPTVLNHINRAGTYAAVSSSGTGVHVVGLLPDGLPDGVAAIGSPLDLDESRSKWPEAEIEAYATKRFVGLTGWHILESPREVADITEFVGELCETFATVSESGPNPQREPNLTREELADVDWTADISDIYDAIQQTKPSDIRLKSTETDERNGGIKDLDPSWANSDSGTRLAQFPTSYKNKEGLYWVYRKGMYGLDSLQVVALEEGIITNEDDYPSGEAFWRAVDALRDRGATIPRFVDEDELEALEANAQDDAEDEDTVYSLAGQLALKSTRRSYERDCPDCGQSVAESENSDFHLQGCKLKEVPAQTIARAYEAIIQELDREDGTHAHLREEISDWGPVHGTVFDHLRENGHIAPAGEVRV